MITVSLPDPNLSETFEVAVKPLHTWSTSHLVIALAGVVLLIVGVLQLAERAFTESGTAPPASIPAEPAQPEPLEVDVYIEDGDKVVVETSRNQRTRVETDGDAASAEALADCIRKEIDRMRNEPLSDEDRAQNSVMLFGLRIEDRGSDPRINRAVQTCVLGSIEDRPRLPELPDLPETD